MARKPLRLVAPFLAGFLGLLLLVAPGASASGGVAKRSVSADASRAALDYWTPARMRAATPLPLPEPTGVSPTALAAPPTALPQSSRLDYANTIAPRAPRGLPKVKPGDRPPFTSGEVPLATQTTFPTSTNGRLFGTLRGLGQYSCSATVIASDSQSVLLTAGHCVHDINAGFARKVIFAPAYRNGDRPFGTWSASKLVATKQWQRAVNFNYDYAAIRLRKSKGETIGSVVGEQGVAYDQARQQDFQAVGYPFNIHRAELMWNCVAPFAGIDPRDRTSGLPDNAIGCDMKQGASGGGWFVVDAAGTQFINSVTSFGYRMIRKTLFGPYLTAKVLDVIGSADR